MVRYFSKGTKRSKKKTYSKGSTVWLNSNVDKLKDTFQEAYRDYAGDDYLMVGLQTVKEKFTMVKEIEEDINQNREK